MRLLNTTFIVSLLFGGGFAAAENFSRAPKPFSFKTFSSQTVYVPASNYTDPRVLYARTVELDRGVLLSTWENYSPGKNTNLACSGLTYVYHHGNNI